MGKRRIYDRHFLELVERMLDKGVVEEREVVVRLPLLDLDVVGVQVRSFVRSYEDSPVDGQILEVKITADDTNDGDDGDDGDDAGEGVRRLAMPEVHPAE
jgi:hypothetical protein